MKNWFLDLTFIPNEPDKTSKERFEQLLKDCKFFDCFDSLIYNWQNNQFGRNKK